MQLPKEGADGLPTDGFDGITLKVIFQGPKGPKGPKRSNFADLLHFANLLKNGLITFFTQLLGDDIDQLSRYGFH